MKKTADEDTRNEAELLHWFHRLATAQDAEEMEKLWEETGASGEARLEAFTRKTLAVSAGFTGTIGTLLARLEPFERIYGRSCGLKSSSGSMVVIPASRWRPPFDHRVQ